MKIYTKRGDTGETSLYGGTRVSKDSPRINAYGTVDELNSHLGLARTLDPPRELDDILLQVQNLLFVLGSDLASSTDKGTHRITDDDVKGLEEVIDRLESSLSPLKTFILPGGSRLGAQLHIARTVCRRAERLVVAAQQSESLGPLPVKFLNRLSDLLFVMARSANRASGVTDSPWTGR